jgi:hypothetical protein
MSWFVQNKDLAGIMIATLAVILSLVTVLIQKRGQQRDAYRQIYDVLMSPELHRGRWVIADIGNGKIEVPDRDTPEFFLIYRTLGVFDALATYARYRIVPRRLVFAVWQHPMTDMREGAEVIRRHHMDRRHTDWKPWAQLWWLFTRLPSDPRGRARSPAAASAPGTSPTEPSTEPASDDRSP